MKTCLILAASASLALLAGCMQGAADFNVRATLEDGQVVVGNIATPAFRLKTGLGTFDFDSRHAGELGPAEGQDMRNPDRAVKLWLKNGSEFVGFWEKPSVTITLEAGGLAVPVDIPIAKLKRLQFGGSDVWDDKPVFRVITAAGDDFFAASTRTRITFRNDFCEISPFLSEVRRLMPADEAKKTWRVELENGTVINAGIPQGQVLFHLDMGPKTISVPLASIEFMDRQTLYRNPAYVGLSSGTGSLNDGDQSETKCYELTQTDIAQRRAREAQANPPGYYSNVAQKAAKASAGKQWKKQE